MDIFGKRRSVSTNPDECRGVEWRCYHPKRTATKKVDEIVSTVGDNRDYVTIWTWG